MQRSWSWIAARLSPRRIWSSDNAVLPRTCLASIEPLGDRIMFSVEVPPLTGDAAILAAVIKGELPLVNAEQDLLTLAGTGLTAKTQGDFEKLTHAFAKVDDTVYAAASDIFLKLDGIKGESADHKHKDTIEILSVEFQKIDQAMKALGARGVENEAPAAKFENQTLDLVKSIQGMPGGDLDAKSEALFAKIMDGFETFDLAIIKAQSDLITVRKAGKDQQEYLKIKL